MFGIPPEKGKSIIPESILAMGKEIAEKVCEVNISIKTPEEFNQKIVRDWRGMIDAQINYITQNLEVIGNLEAKFSEFVIHKKEEKEKSLELIQKRERLDKINKDYSKSKKELDESDKKLRDMDLEGQALLLKKTNLEWLLESKPEHERLKEQIAKEDKNYQDIRAQLLELLPKIEKLKFEKSNRRDC
ncbi:MAG: hypothetical protein QME42_07245 [bacterium]|nr:hypothetical protein [bacterium]